MSKSVSQWLHALLVGAAVAALAAVNGSVSNAPVTSWSSDPTVLAILGVVSAAASRFIGVLVGKLGA